MVDSLYKQCKVHANINSSAIAKIGMVLSEADMQDFLPFPTDQESNLPMSKETTLILLIKKLKPRKNKEEN